MPEKREGQELIRLYLPSDLKDRFKLYCQLKGTTMTEVIKEQISKLLESEDLTELLEKRLKDG
jgi:predicted DNA-binding protein